MKFTVNIGQAQEGSCGYDAKVANGMRWEWEVRSDDFYGFSFQGVANYEAQAREDVAVCVKNIMDRAEFKHPQAEAVERIAKANAEAASKQCLALWQRVQEAEKAAKEANERAAKIEAGRVCGNFVEPAPEATDDESI